MNRSGDGSRRAGRSVAAIAVLGVTLSLLPAQGLPARSAEAQWLKTTVAEGDHIALGCGRDPGPSASGTIFGMYSLTDDAGNLVARGPVPVSFSSDEYVAVTVMDGHQEIQVSEGEVNGEFFSVTSVVAPTAGTLRAAWARWGLDASCILMVNQVEVTDWTTGGEGRYAFPTDFTGGAAVGAVKCGLPTPMIACLGVGIAAAQDYSFTSSGYLFAALLPAPGGVARVQDPEGGDRIGPTPLFVAASSPGAWTFSLIATVSSGSPVLWILDVPA